MAREIQLVVILPKNRDHTGELDLLIDGKPKAQFRVLGRGSSTTVSASGKIIPTGNPTRSPLLSYGDTPKGDYKVVDIEEKKDRKKYGPYGVLRLHAVSGDAFLAEALGRRGLLIHGGPPGKYDGYRPTLGCLRVSDHDMLRLRNILFSAGNDPHAYACNEVSVNVSVLER